MVTRFKKSSLILATTFTGVMAAGCLGGGSDSSSSNIVSGVSSLDSLPAATGPVVSSSSGSAMVVRSLSNLSSSIGTKISDLGSGGGSGISFASTSSRAFCENANLIKNVLKEAAGPDKILCYISAMKRNEIVPASENVYDGNWHHWRLTIPGEAGQPVVKFKILKDSSGKISEFKMFSCFEESGGSPIQSEYISQVFSGSSATLTSKYLGQEDNSGTPITFGAEVSATGTINSSGGWTSKNLVARNYSNEGANSFSMYMDLNQFVDYITLTGYQKGSFSFGGNAMSFENKMSTYVETLNTTELSTFSLGHGSSKVEINFTHPGGTDHPPVFTESWNGDTREKDTTSQPYLAQVSTDSLPTVPGSVSGVSFSTEESWDCDVTNVSPTDANLSAGPNAGAMLQDMMSCEAKFSPGNDWVDCSQVQTPQ